jgi:putative mRNA 3-end processing factor
VPKVSQRAFRFRGGVRVEGTILACDATSGSDLIFLSHAQALDARGARLLPRPRAGKRQILTTEATLALLGAPGARLRPHALTPAFGRPFALGGMRLELFPSGYLPGAASILCDLGDDRVVYAGPTAPATAQGNASLNVRTARAVCVDGTFARSLFRFPPIAEAVAEVLARVQDATSGGRSPVVLVRPLGPALDVAAALHAAGIVVRAHRHVLAAAAAIKAAGLIPTPLLRFAGRLQPGEALLWPPEARQAGLLGGLAAPLFILASGWACDPAVVDRLGADVAVPLSNQGGFDDLLAYVRATGATEVAIRHAVDDQFTHALADQGIDAYRVGPPQQILLF